MTEVDLSITEDVSFFQSTLEDDPQFLITALRGVTMALLDQDVDTSMDQADVDRMEGLHTAAFVLARQLAQRMA